MFKKAERQRIAARAIRCHEEALAATVRTLPERGVRLLLVSSWVISLRFTPSILPSSEI
jgi:hypothetical protein